MYKKIITAAVAGLVAGGLGGFYSLPAEEVEVTKYINVTETVTEYIETPVNVTVEVPVDNENLSLVLEHIYDNEGDVDYLTDDLKEEDVEMIVDRIAFVNDVKSMAVAEVESELFDEIDGDDVNGVELDEDELERLRIDDDADEISLSDVDFDNFDANVRVTGTFEQDEIEYDFSAVVKVKDYKVDKIKHIDIN